MHSGRKDPFWKLPLFLCRGPGLPSSSRLCPAFDERRHSERGLHHLPQRRAKPEVTGVLRYDDRRGWLDCKYLRLFSVPTSIIDASVHLAQHPSHPHFTILWPSFHPLPSCPTWGFALSSGPCSAAHRFDEAQEGIRTSRLQWPSPVRKPQENCSFCGDTSCRRERE